MTDLDATFAEAKRLLAGLVSGEVSREEAADWAWPMVVDDERYPAKLWEALGYLAGADLQVAPGKYLHGEADFRAWQAAVAD
ncbi:hypothetical protein LWC34_40305 [Kibdelosporangium philippinense]|uniref:SUKH-3 immunity protein n=1 Tax=Kibdelosporangium philippinense TaxID=211113 RepID=A0ABS8ZMN8_9PSEU|nr:hypothetical protein [Kibdelosporangium philippinense]MCE7009014.1 hypothetical protein [Kibdelosporangium philippinense]